MSDELTGKVAVITAAASGMGREASLLFAGAGATVVAIDIDAEAGESLVGDVAQRGGTAEFMSVDMTDLEQIRDAARVIGERHGHVDVLFNHVGTPGPRGFDYSETDWDFAMSLNLRAPIFMTKAALPLLQSAPDGASIIFTSSAAGLVASVNSPIYSALKAGVLGYMRGVAAKLAPEGIRANAICPGVTETPMLAKFFASAGEDPALVPERLAAFKKTVPLGRACRPEEVAELALFLASDRSSFITGVAVPIDGGYVAM
jgi:NAD(P)-dependent dehydrogenase (short-subunit alcohol dehydrogenase family)